MKKIILYFILGVTALSYTSCEDFLDTEDLTHKTTGNFPATLTEAQELITGIYSNLNLALGDPQTTFFFLAQLASDDCLGGGGMNDKPAQATDMLLQAQRDSYALFWERRYVGINRANNAIATLGNCTEYQSEDQKNQLLGEAYFLRAFFYYELASMFENIPLHLTTEAVPLPQASPDDTWAQIISDLKTAIELMPAKKASGDGHVDKYCAEAMMARAWMFYTGFYGKTEVTLPGEGAGTVTKQNVIDWLTDCKDNSGYSLVADYRNLWAYGNEKTRADYPYMDGVAGTWPEDNGGVNPESMFIIKFSQLADWDGSTAGHGTGYMNGYCLFFGVRSQSDYNVCFPFGQGWGMAPGAPNLWSDWTREAPGDIRRQASMIQWSADYPGYVKGCDTFTQETDFWNKKIVTINTLTNLGGTFEEEMYDIKDLGLTYSRGSVHPLVLIRFADVVLMHAELTGAVSPELTQLRTRANSPFTGADLATIQKERRYELAFEGIRWNDMRRWGMDYAKAALEAQTNVPVWVQGEATTNKAHGGGYAARYEATRGFVAIPESQITLSQGTADYKQNAGWVSDEISYPGW